MNFVILKQTGKTFHLDAVDVPAQVCAAGAPINVVNPGALRSAAGVTRRT